MSRVGGKNTGPEVRVRKAAHALGLRFRLHRKELPGTPDIIFPKRRVALFVHGCYWHRHPGCRKATAPSSDFWANKFAMNVARDARVAAELKRHGWRVVTIWECQTKHAGKLARILTRKVIRPTSRRRTARPSIPRKRTASRFKPR